VSVVVHVENNGVRVPVAAARLAELARRVCRSEGIRDAMLSVTFVTTSAIAALNRRHLGRRGSTDVIAFGLSNPMKGGPVLGDIYISPDVARSNARTHGRPVREEIARLVVHGALHVLGYTHPEGGAAERIASDMWKRQEEHLRRGIPQGKRA
jgi:probable rRNA maturation factor